MIKIKQDRDSITYIVFDHTQFWTQDCGMCKGYYVTPDHKRILHIINSKCDYHNQFAGSNFTLEMTLE